MVPKLLNNKRPETGEAVQELDKLDLESTVICGTDRYESVNGPASFAGTDY